MGMGAADVVPGVSGGTIALIIGVYFKLLDAVKSFDARFLKLFVTGNFRQALGQVPWGFLLPLLSGILLSIFTLAQVVTFLLTKYPAMLWAFFFGLIVASIFILLRQAKPRSISAWLIFACGLLGGWILTGATAISLGHSLPVIFCSGFVAICALILPGISGSFMLVLLGQYEFVIDAVANLNFLILLVFALGCACGLLSFSRVVSALLKRFPVMTMAFFVGVMTGSLRVVWPWHCNGFPSLPPVLDLSVLAAGLCCLVGIALPLGMEWLTKWKRVRQIDG